MSSRTGPRGVRSFAARRRALRRVVMAVVMVLVVVVGLPLGSATAYQAATTVTQAGQVVTGNTPSGWTWAATTSGATTVLDAVSSPGTYAATSAMFTPNIAANSPMDRISTSLATCPATGLCSGLGTVTVNFSQPVTNPVMHVMGIGAQASGGGGGTIFHVTPTLTASTPAGASLGAPSAGATNMRVTGGTVIDATNYLASTTCGALTTGATALSVCGSVPVVGTVTSLTFTITAQAKPYSGSGTTNSGAADAWGLLVTAPEDFGDAPASYDAAGAAANVIGDLKLGATIDEDNANVVNATTSPNAVGAGVSANGANGDGADEDALGTWPSLTTAAIGSTYSVTVPISGASKAGQVCGWIDFNRNGTFDTGERACTAFASGAASAVLIWTVPTTSAGTTYARLRASYGAATMLPTGASDSGETEDYTVAIMPVVKVTKVLAAGSGGTFDLKVNGTTLATGVGNGGTTGAKTVFNTSAFGAPSVTVAQDVSTTPVPLTVAEANAAGNAFTYSTTYSCVNATGATVGSGSATSASVSIPASTGSNGTAQNISCTFTNTQNPSLSLLKSVTSVTDVNGNTIRDTGDKINYSFLVTNTGGAALTNVGVTDPKVTGISCPGTTLALGASMTCTAVYTITQADTDAGSVPNTATASGKFGATTVTATSSVTTTIPSTAALALQKTVASVVDSNADGKNDAGDKINWTFKVTNTGNVTITTVAVTDPKAGVISCPVTTLAPGAFTTCTAASYTITQAEGDAAVATNTATATGKSPTNATVTSPTSSTSTVLVRSPTLTLTKSAVVTDVNANSKNDLGDKIQWSFLVKNTGNVTTTSLAISDAKAGTVSCPVATLAPGASTTCTATVAYTVTQADVDAGVVTNTATAHANQPSGALVTSNTSTTTTTIVQTSALQLTKTAAVTDVNTDGLNDLGDKIQWSFLVKNTGTVTINTVAISDATAGAANCPVTTLTPNASTTCTATVQHTITQADVDAGVVSNTATATGKSPSNATVTSNTSSTATPVAQSTKLALVKSAAVIDVNSNGKTDLGDKIQWSFLTTNTGTVTINTLAIADAKAGAVTCPVTTLAPGAQTTCTATTQYVITQADVDSGSVNNTATASAKNPGGSTVSSTPSSTSTPINQVSALTLTKSAAVTDVNADGKTNLGDKIQWSFLVKNTGTVTLTTTAVTDAKAGAISCPVTTLAPNASTTCTAAAYTITQADVDAGVVNNTATATAKNPANATVTSPTSSTSTPVNQVSALTLTKSAAVTDVNANGKNDLGDKIQWSFLVKNTGTVTITTTAITDAKAGATTCPVTTLAPGATTTCTATVQYVITQADVDNGVVSNSAVAAGKNPANAVVTSNTSQTDTPLNQAPALQLTKSAAVTDVNGNGKNDLGDKIQWSFLVKNTGTVTLTTLAIVDAKAGATTCPVTTLAPNASTTCTATTPYVITQADVDAGVVNNTATATTKNPSGTTVTSNTSSTSTTIAQTFTLQLTKSAGTTDVNANGSTDLGDKVNWTFLIRNTGTTTISTIAVSDPIAGAVSCLATTLAPGATTTCTVASHTVTQTDVDNGIVSNSAVASGKNPANATVTSNTSNTDTPVAQASTLQLTKSAAVTDVDSDGKTDLSDKIVWSFLVKNTGTVTITTLAVNDPTAGAISCPVTTLAPGASTTCTSAAHTITQSEVDAAVVNNTATATGQNPSNSVVTSNSSSTSTPVAQTDSLQLTKSAAVTDVDGDGATDLGDTIAWSFLVKNTGTTTITTTAVSDPTAGAVSCPVTTLAPGASTTCTAVAHTIVQSDVDAGVVSNTATATGKNPAGGTVTSNPSSTATAVTHTSNLKLVKKATVTDVNNNFKTDLGDTIAWTFQLTNTGTATLTGAAVTDPTAGAVSCPTTTLLPGGTTTCTAAAHVITQADVDAGVVNNTANATALDSGGVTVNSNPSSTSTAVNQVSALTLNKSAVVTDVNSNGKTDLGDRIAWSFLVKNTGTVTVNTTAVSDAKAGAVSCPVTTLAPGAQTTCTATTPYTITQADVDAAVVNNTATATAKNPPGTVVTSNPSSTSTPVVQTSSLQLTKSAAVTDVNANAKNDLGDKIQWSFLVKNTGTATITSVAVSDASAGAVTCPVTTLAPGAQTTCTATAQHTISQADVDAGVVSNSATATGKNPSNSTITSNVSSTDTTVAQAPALQLTKSAALTDVNGNGKTDLGDTIAWSFLVKNSGTTTIHGLAVNDAKAGAVSCPTTTLAPGAQTTCTATTAYSITQADVDAGVVNNTATASGLNPANTPVTSNSSSTSTPVTQANSLLLTKSAVVNDIDGDFIIDLGDKVQWSFLVKNTGSGTITGIAISDLTGGAVTCPVTTLAPGAQTTCTATVLHTITQADVDAGVVNNTASATGTSPLGTTITSNLSSTSTPVAQSPAVSVTKSASVTDANSNSITDLGDSIVWTFLVKNTGTVTLTTVAVSDAKAGSVSCPTTTIAPGASTTCSAAGHTITQAEVDAGVVSNTATASGKAPNATTVTSAPSSTNTPVAQTSALNLTKSAAVTDVNADGATDLGDRITWSFLVKNTGTVTLTTVGVSDAKAGAVSCPVTTLAPAASTTCTSAAYTIVQSDVDAGVVTNTATASGQNPSNSTVTSNSSTTNTAVTQVAALTLTKSAAVTDVNANGKTDLGDRITWSFLVKNTGTSTLTTVAVSDAKAGAVSCPLTTLAPGVQTTCTAAAHTITQAEVDAGVVNNTATASGKNPSNVTVTSSPSSTSTPVAQTSSMTLTKSASVSDLNSNFKIDLGDRVTWTMLVKNTGTTTINTVAVSDPSAGPVSCPLTTLAPAASTTCTVAAHIITQADVDAGIVSNTATASAKDPQANPIAAGPSVVDTPVDQNSGIQLTKTALITDIDSDGKTDLGDKITWSFLVKNTGSVTLNTVAVNDPKAGAVSCPVTTLAPGVSTTCTSAAYTITQTDVDAGSVTNTATATGRNPSAATVTSTSSSTTTPVVQTSTLLLTKAAAITDVNADSRTDLGDKITWSFIVKNTGSTTVTTVAVNDPKAGAISCPTTTLAPGASTTCTSGPHTVTQADVDAGVVSNTATSTGKNPSNAVVTSNPSSADTPIAQAPAVSLTKSAGVTDVDGDGKTDLGDRIAWSFLVTNTGTTTINTIAISDAKAGAVSCPVTTLAPGASTTCTATSPYTITQPDVDAGHVANTATASAEDSTGNPIVSPSSSTDTPVVQSPGVSLVKSAATQDQNGDFKIDLGDTITWSFLVRNTGSVTVTGLTINDPMAGVTSCPVTILAPGAQTTCTSTAHTITQADVDAGVVSNSATATVNPPSGPAVTSPPSSTDTPVVQVSGLSLAKSAAVNDVNGDAKTDLGDRITWSFVVQNTGTTTVTSVAVNDPTAGPVICPVTTLAPGASTTCTSAAYTITQADVDAAHVANTATVSARNPGGTTVTSPPSSTDTLVAQSPGLALAKSAAVNDVNGDTKNDLGDTIIWSFLVTNTGTTTVSSLAITDPTAGAVSCPVTSLAPGASTTCTSGPHTVTQADVDTGVVSNTATAGGQNPQGGPVTSPTSSTDTTIDQAPALSLVKTAAITDVNGDSRIDITDTIIWSFQVTNTGTTTVSGITVSDPMAGAVSCPVTALAPGASTTCTSGAYTITQVDMDAGAIDNTATASGTAPNGNPVLSNPSSVHTVVSQRPNPALTKMANVSDNNGNFRIDLGDTINWSFLVENTGNVTLDTIEVTDPIAGAVTCPSTTLAVGGQMTCTAAPHVITQDDVDAGFVDNVATASGHSPSAGTTFSNDSSTDTPVDQQPSVGITKSAAATDVDSDGHTDLGDTIQWSFLIENTGTTTMTSVVVDDPKAGPVTCPVTTLAPGETTTCTADSAYTVTQADVDAGQVANSATATANDPSGTPHVSSPSTTETVIDQTTGVALTKSAVVTDANANGANDLGDTIVWSFLVTNTGTTTLHNVAVDDPTAGAVSCPVTTLAPGGSTTCTAAAGHIVTQADVDAGIVSNTATATADEPSGGTWTSAPSSTDTPIQQTPGLHLVKSALAGDVDGDGQTDLGDTISWTFLVTNTGTVTVHGVTVDDPTAGSVTCPAGFVAPGASVTCTAADHVVTQADVDAGHVDNSATSSALTPSGATTTSNPSATTTPIHQVSSVSLTKSAAVTDADSDGHTDLGDAIAWSFLVTNTGTTTATTVAVADPKAGLVSCPTTTLLPGASTTCTAAAYSITQADVDAGVVSNTATASANDPAGTVLGSGPSSTDTTVDQSPAVSLTKSASVTDVDGDGDTGLGDTITWSFLVTNTGTTSISTVAISDAMAGAVSCLVTSLPRGTATTCTSAPYVITQADVDAGVVSNTATATAQDPGGHGISSPPSSSDTTVDQSAGLSIVKSATVNDVNSDLATDLGDTIQWSFVVRNTGTTTVHAIVVADPKAGAVSCPATTLAPGASTTCSAAVAYPITQADVDAGDVSNTATASGLDPANVGVNAGPSTTDTAVTQAPALSLVKSAAVADTDGDGLNDLGDSLHWSFLVTNTGTTTLDGLTVSDPMAGAVSCPVTTLAPGASTTCAAGSYVVTQPDVDAGVVSNTAAASALDPQSHPVASPDSSTDTTIARAPALTLVKSATVTDVDTDGKTDLGDTVTWSFAVTNSGTTTVTSLTVVDPKAGAVSCPVTTLAPGASTTCTSGPHTVTQAEVDAGWVSNSATAHGSSAGAPVVSPVSSTDTPVAQNALLGATKAAVVTDVNGNGKTDKGDRITWSVTVHNTGTVTVSGITITDPKAGPMTCAATSVAPGTSTVCTATTPYTITQPDVDAGHVDNTATASGFDPGGAQVDSPPASVTTPVVAVPALSLVKTASTFDVDSNGVVGVGDTISWHFLVTNSGSVTLDNLAVDDPTAGAVTCPVTTLAPAASTTCTAAAPHTVTQADVDSGDVSNTATASATDPAALAIVSLPSSTDTELDQLAQLRLVKHGVATDVNHDGITDAGDTILWSFDVTNSGRVTLDTVDVTDTKAGPVTCLKTTLAVGESTTCVATSSYTVTTADANAGSVHNVATATGFCACRAAVKAVKAAAVVATKRHAPSDPADPPAPSHPGHHWPEDPVIVPGLPFTGAMGVAWAIRGGLMALVAGAFLLLVARRRSEDDDDEPCPEALTY